MDYYALGFFFFAALLFALLCPPMSSTLHRLQIGISYSRIQQVE
jgi:hypothetical protein